MSEQEEEPVISADFDVITCQSCRECVPMGRTCSCPARTFGPSVEPALPRLVVQHNAT